MEKESEKWLKLRSEAAERKHGVNIERKGGYDMAWGGE